ncbi:MAG: hypothetical protein AB1445_04160 [Bacillota bacterium]
MIAGTRAGRLLSGYRGAHLNSVAVVDVLTGVSRLLEAYPEIQEIASTRCGPTRTGPSSWTQGPGDATMASPGVVRTFAWQPAGLGHTLDSPYP